MTYFTDSPYEKMMVQVPKGGSVGRPPTPPPGEKRRKDQTHGTIIKPQKKEDK